MACRYTSLLCDYCLQQTNQSASKSTFVRLPLAILVKWNGLGYAENIGQNRGERLDLHLLKVLVHYSAFLHLCSNSISYHLSSQGYFTHFSGS